MTEIIAANRIGYARVSTYGQTLDAQLAQLRGNGCATIYREEVSGAQTDRRELRRMLRKIEAGDVVTVTRIGRLARSTSTYSPSTSRSPTQRHVPISSGALDRYQHQHQHRTSNAGRS